MILAHVKQPFELLVIADMHSKYPHVYTSNLLQYRHRHLLVLLPGLSDGQVVLHLSLFAVKTPSKEALPDRPQCQNSFPGEYNLPHIVASFLTLVCEALDHYSPLSKVSYVTFATFDPWET